MRASYIVNFSSEGVAVPDAKAEAYAKKLLKEDLHISNLVVLNFIRILVKKGEIPYKKVVLYFPEVKNQKPYYIDKDSNFPEFPQEVDFTFKFIKEFF